MFSDLFISERERERDSKIESRTFLDKLRLNSYINLDRTERNAFESRQKIRRRVTRVVQKKFMMLSRGKVFEKF